MELAYLSMGSKAPKKEKELHDHSVTMTQQRSVWGVRKESKKGFNASSFKDSFRIFIQNNLVQKKIN